MKQGRTVKVFNFRTYDPERQMLAVARFKAEREVIVSRFGGEVLEGTGHEVPCEEIDEQGRYRRVATGWGELGSA